MKYISPEPTQARLKQLFDYNPETGLFTRIVGRSGKGGKAGTIVLGVVTKKGYLAIEVDSRNTQLHRAAWIWMHGEIPEGWQIDHKNGIRNDNRLRNLRIVKAADNMQNKGIYKNNTSGFPGVFWEEDRQKWVVRIRLNGKQTYLGRFHKDDFEKAKDAYLKARKNLFDIQPVPRYCCE